MWTLFVCASIGLIFTFIEKEWEIFSYCILISMCPLLYFGVSGYKKGVVKPYRPGRGYWSYRLLARNKNINLVSLFELEELGIIEQGQKINYIHMDFDEWHRAEENQKVAVVTRDSLIVVVMSSPEYGERYEIGLKKIFGIHFWVDGQSRSDMILTLKMDDGSIVRIALEGKYRSYTTALFANALLEAMDGIYLGENTAVYDDHPMRAQKPAPIFTSRKTAPMIQHRDAIPLDR